MKNEFLELGYKIYGISKDNVNAQKRFIEKQNLEIELLSDVDTKLATALDVYKPKKLYGKEYMGIERSTFVFDKNLEIVKEYRKVSVKDHAKTVLEDLKQL